MRPWRIALWFFRLLAEVLIGLAGTAAAGSFVLAWRLSEGPVDITPLVRREKALLLRPGMQLDIGSATLAWAGFRAPDQPLEIEAGNIALASPDGAKVTVAHGRIALALDELLRGRLAPRNIEAAGASASLVRGADGTINAGLPGAPANAAQGTPQHGTAFPLLHALTSPPHASGSHPLVSQLTHLSIHDSHAEMRDARTGAVLRGTGIEVELQRQPAGGISGAAHVDVSAGAAAATLTARVEVAPDGTHLTMNTTPLSPAAVALLDPGFTPAAAIDAPLSLALDARFGPDMALLAATLDATLAAGKLQAGKGTLLIDGAAAHATVTASQVNITAFHVDFAKPDDAHAPPPVLTGQALVTHTGDRLHAAFGIGLANVAFADLARYWPEGIGGGARAWVTANIVAGRAHDAQVGGTIDSATDLSDLALTSLTGGLAGDDLTVYWLKPVPPVERGRVRLVLESPDALHVDILRGEQGALQLTGGSVRITGLSAKDQVSQIDADLQGSLQATLALLNHPRLGLLSRRPLDITDPSGSLQAHLSVHLPLEDRVSLDDIAIKARATLTDVHLGHLALSRDLDQASLTLAVDNDGLTLDGHGLFASIPTDLTLDMDFRDGPPAQVLQHVTAEAHPDARQLQESDLPAGIVTGGQAQVSVDYTARRDHTDTISVDADLTQAVLATPMSWNKPAGSAASAGAILTLRDGKLAGLDHLHAEGPGLKLTSHVEVEGGVLQAIVLDQVAVGRSAVQGRIGLPTKAANRVAVTLQGPRLDLSGYLEAKPAKPQEPAKPQAGATPPAPAAPKKRGLAWSADLHFDRVDLAHGQALSPVSVRAVNDGLRFDSAQLDAGTPSAINLSITQTQEGRLLRVTSADAGGLLAASGSLDNIHQGKLSLTATAAAVADDAPFAGTATLTDFQITDAPGIGKLMQGMTLYGLVDALRGPGLHFSKLVAPFSWQSGVLTLSNARAFSPSLGLTAKGTIDLRQHHADIGGTIVPAYFFNQLLGNIPVLGKVFSPEKGGGVFAARYTIRGPLADPKIGINPFSALTPGFLRGLFGPLP